MEKRKIPAIFSQSVINALMRACHLSDDSFNAFPNTGRLNLLILSTNDKDAICCYINHRTYTAAN